MDQTAVVRITRIERIGEAVVGMEPGDVVARSSADGAEVAARQNLAVHLGRECIRQSRSGCGLNEVRHPVVGSSRAGQLRVWPPMSEIAAH